MIYLFQILNWLCLPHCVRRNMLSTSPMSLWHNKLVWTFPLAQGLHIPPNNVSDIQYFHERLFLKNKYGSVYKQSFIYVPSKRAIAPWCSSFPLEVIHVQSKHPSLQQCWMPKMPQMPYFLLIGFKNFEIFLSLIQYFNQTKNVFKYRRSYLSSCTWSRSWRVI